MRDAILTEIMMRRNANKRISAACGLSTAAVSQWTRVPRKHVETVSKLSGKQPHELRPDLYAASTDVERAA
ncbi:hypothetical protein [Acetobacter okinawensis]|uniref:hypothetical protein n=1 Tax=Acetobacter okinawensis TaxID=1076594 RepID=UPI0039ECADC4